MYSQRHVSIIGISESMSTCTWYDFKDMSNKTKHMKHLRKWVLILYSHPTIADPFTWGKYFMNRA